MTGPRITSGVDSKQNYATPLELVMAASIWTGLDIVCDLAADATNARHTRYLAPRELTANYDPQKPFAPLATADLLAIRGANLQESLSACQRAVQLNEKSKIVVKNHDEKAFGLNAFVRNWTDISLRWSPTPGVPGLCWLNPEFSDIDPWAERCATEAALGAHIAFLVPASTGATWFRKHVVGYADVRFLTDRVCFDGKSPFPKDCLLAYYHPNGGKVMEGWSWKKDKVFWRTDTVRNIIEEEKVRKEISNHDYKRND